LSLYTFHRRRPGNAYINRNLWLPKDSIPVRVTKKRLTFRTAVGKNRDELFTFHAFREEERHLVVPRNFMSVKEVEEMGIPVTDLRPTSYEHVNMLHSIVPRAWQVEPTQKMETVGDGTLNVACGKGKTVMALYEAARMGVPTMVICQNGSILKQWEREIRKFIDFDGDIRWVQGKSLPMEAPFALATIQTLYNRVDLLPREFVRRWGLIIFDEAHHVSAPQFCKAADLFPGRRLALTATAKRNDGLEKIYQYHLGEVFHVDLEQDLKPTIVFLALPGFDPPKHVNDDVSLKTWLSRDPEFNAVIAKEVRAALKKGRTMLVLSHRIEQVMTLNELVPEGRSIFGTVKLEERDEILRSANPIFASMTLAKEGLDRPQLDTVLCATLFSNPNDFQQVVGRVQRAFSGKQDPVAVFCVPSIDRCKKQARRLASFARKAGYTVEHHRA